MSHPLKIESSGETGAAASSVSPIRVTIPVTGMTCAACQSFVQRTLASQAGVQDASVNLMLHNATVTFDPGVTSTAALVDTIRETGYGAEIPIEHSSALVEQEEHDAEQLREYSQLRLKAVVSLVAGFFAMLLSMPLMSASSIGGMERVKDPLMNWSMRVLDPVLRRVLPWMYRVSDDVIRWFLLCSCSVHSGLGRASVLYEGLVCAAAQDGRYEYPGGARYGVRLSLLSGEHDSAWVLRRTWNCS